MTAKPLALESQEQKLLGDASPTNKLGSFEKPFKQKDVNYVMTASNISERCAVCAFFRQKEKYDPCLIIRNDDPLPIVEGGHCNRWESIVLPDISETVEDLAEEIVDTISNVVENSPMQIRSRDPNFLEKMKKLLMGEAAKQKGELVSFEKLLEESSGFKTFEVQGKNYYLGWYSNNFQDKEKDIFTEKGFDLYNEKVNSGEWPMPELWSMHQPYLKHGEGIKVFRIGHFQFSLGKFDDPDENPLVPHFLKYYEENPVTMSHGFLYDPDFYKNKVFELFMTFETSTTKVGREANSHYTSLEVMKEAKMLKGEDRTFVAGIIGEDNLQKLEKDAETRGKVLEDAGIKWKTFQEEAELGEKASVTVAPILLAMKQFTADAETSAKAAEEAVKIAGNHSDQIEKRLGNIEGSVERIKLTLLGLMDPTSAKTSPLTQVDDGNVAANHIQEQNEKGSQGRKLSIVEELAIGMGDDPSIYGQNGSS